MSPLGERLDYSIQVMVQSIEKLNTSSKPLHYILSARVAAVALLALDTVACVYHALTTLIYGIGFLVKKCVHIMQVISFPNDPALQQINQDLPNGKEVMISLTRTSYLLSTLTVSIFSGAFILAPSYISRLHHDLMLKES